MSSAFRLAAAALACCVFAGPSARAADPPTALGFWVTEDHESVIEITPCDSGLCGRIVGLRHDHPPGTVPKDDHNPNPAQRDTPLCSMLFMGSFKPAADGKGWEGGWVYDPGSGKTYSAHMALDGADTLKLRGFIGVPLLGRSQTWTREGGTLNRCQKPA